MIYLFLLFTVIPVIELAILIKVGNAIGTINTIVLLLVAGALGAYLARVQGFMVMQRIQEQLAQGLMPTEEMLDGFLLLIGGILLLTPGLLTDVWGFFLIFPWSRALLKIFLKNRFNAMISTRSVGAERRWQSSRYTDIDI